MKMVFEDQTVIERISWNDEAQIDITMGRGIIIDQRAFKKSGKTQIKQKKGIHSPFFGTDWDDENPVQEKYRCNCGSTIGRIYEGMKCPECNTVVGFHDADLTKFGWVHLKQYSVIHPVFFKSLTIALGRNIFPNIIQNGEIDSNGIKKNKDSKNPYFGIGLIEFKERYDEILTYYKKKRKSSNKQELFDDLLSNKDKVFVNYIPVFTANLRPISLGAETIFMTKIDKAYNVIVSKVRVANNLSEGKRTKKQAGLEISTVLLSIQGKLNNLWNDIFDMIDQKHGHIRENLLGGRVNFTARNVIRPNGRLRADEVILNYHTFVELYRYEIIAHLVRLYNMTYREAYNRWSIGSRDGSLLEVANLVLKNYKPIVLIDRPPTINFGSILAMRVVRISESLSDYTMAIPNEILAPANADFDGDNLTIVSIKSRDLAEAFDRIYNPRKSMFIDRNTGYYNTNMGLHKDQMIGLYQFCNI